MRLDIDSYREILDTITRNKTRSLLTGFGVFWGVFMLIALIGGGQGLKGMLQQNFEGFATNSSMISAEATTKAYKGFRKGRLWTMDTRDVERLRQQVPELDVVTPLLFCYSNSAVAGEWKASCHVEGVVPEYARVCEPRLLYGRYINQLDMQQSRKVCVIGSKVYDELFPDGGDPCGRMLRIDSIYYEVVGVNVRSGAGINIGGSAEETVTLPLTVVQRAYNRGSAVDIIAVTGRPGVVMSSLTGRMRAVVARAHTIYPDDEQAVMVFNTEMMFAIIDNLFRGVNFLIWLVGIGTLLAGAIGVSNIMMVTVRERTTEIGIRRAIGATPRDILSQIMSESVVLTAVAGMSGILFAVGILQMADMAVASNAVRFQVSFATALFATLLLAVLGLLAGLAPAWRAMSIKPVDAMRDE